jgi:hypothetical protein
MKAISNTLMHFLGRGVKSNPDNQFGVFRQILRDGVLLSETRFTFPDGTYLYNYCACFTDIPLNFCDDHVGEYGKFGIGFKKESIRAKGGNPVRYTIPPDTLPATYPLEPTGILYWNLKNLFLVGRLIDHMKDHPQDWIKIFESVGIKFQVENTNAIPPEKVFGEMWQAFLQIFGFEKQTQDMNSTVLDQYYYEREWRVVNYDALLEKKIVKKMNDNLYMQFHRDDVRLVVVPDEKMRLRVNGWFGGKNDQDILAPNSFMENPPSILVYDDLKYF